MDNTNAESESQMDIGKYESALQLMFYEGQISWQMNVLFVGFNVGIGAIIQEHLYSFDTKKMLLFIVSVIGLVINVFWLGTFRRNNRYYHFRMAQAREAEPNKWHLLSVEGYKFSKGKKIVKGDRRILYDDRIHQLSKFEKMTSNKRAIGVAIWAFILGFGLILLILLFQFICSKL
jgi:hypothetical protein